jgi:hypothetical protein
LKVNRFKNINHGDTADTAKNQKPVFAFASRRVRCVAVVNCFFKVHYTPRSQGFSAFAGRSIYGGMAIDVSREMNTICWRVSGLFYGFAA